MMFGDVLVPLDGSERADHALEVAIPICRHLDSKLRVVTYTESADLSPTYDRLVSRLELLPTADIDIDIRVEVPSKDVAHMLLGLLQASPGTLLCMTTHGRGRSELFTGSVANEILRETSSPVMLIGPGCETDRFTVAGPVVIAADGSQLSETIVPVATAWAIVSHSPVEVVTVLDPKTSYIAEASHGDLSESTYVRHLANTISKDLGRRVEFEVLHNSHPARSIVDHVHSEEVGLIAMATHGVAGLARVTAGSVTTEVVRTSPVPVLVVRPADLAG